jgi:hypothetical protein
MANHEISGFEFLRSLSGRRSKAQISQIGFDLPLVEKFIQAMPYDIPGNDVSDN